MDSDFAETRLIPAVLVGVFCVLVISTIDRMKRLKQFRKGAGDRVVFFARWEDILSAEELIEIIGRGKKFQIRTQSAQVDIFALHYHAIEDALVHKKLLRS